MTVNKAYFRPEFKDIYFITYNNINDFYCGYTSEFNNFNSNPQITPTKNNIKFEYLEDVEIQEMNFMKDKRFVYYKMNIIGTSST